jgi:fatty acid desaturase
MKQMATITAAPATPQTVPPAAPTPPTGTWQHPRLKEIEQRREASIFTYTKLLHAAVLLGIVVASFFFLGGWIRALLYVYTRTVYRVTADALPNHGHTDL